MTHQEEIEASEIAKRWLLGRLKKIGGPVSLMKLEQNGLPEEVSSTHLHRCFWCLLQDRLIKLTDENLVYITEKGKRQTPDEEDVMGYADLAKCPPGKKKAKDYAIHGLLTDGAHHKQWILEQILIALGYDLEKIHEQLHSENEKEDYDWEPGIPP
jgi:hypothetical protein